MRRNTYEETLFRCEDERFEIDMTIDSNLCTLALLEPYAEEMAILSKNELQTQVDKDNEPKPALEQKGLGGKYYQYTFDPSILGVVHRNSITRIYGDQGQEMLELLKNNPSVAIPIVVRRLRQKDTEWRRVRDRLNRHWKELAEQNYYKSLDHRSLTWRTTDKRAISTRTLISEIKDRAANDGNEGQAALQARIDKAKEEHGSFYEVTMAKSLTRKRDLSTLPRPDRRLFTPHMSFMYENNNWVQRDAYRILSFALERGSISPTDKERCHRLWTEFLGPLFNLSLNWMLSPAASYQETTAPAVSSKDLTRIVTQDENSEEESLDEEGEINSRIITEDAREASLADDKVGSQTLLDHHPLPAGSTVSTVYGEGQVIRCRKEDGLYEVLLPLGAAFLRPSAVLCSILAAEKSAYTTQRRNDDRTKLDRPDDKLVIGTQSLYVFLRLHQILCRRLGIAKSLAYEVAKDSSLQTLVEQMPGHDDAALGKRRYDAFLSLVYALLDGGTGSAAEGGKYEDRVRSLLGHGGYELATMDKLISHILKNIQSMANDDTMWSLVQLFRRHMDAGGFKPEAFRQEAAYLSDGEQMYAFQLCPVHKDGGDKSVLYMEYLGVIAGSEEEDGSLSDPPVDPFPKRQKR
jgi:paired amphipathic helix protein Sin3a